MASMIAEHAPPALRSSPDERRRSRAASIRCLLIVHLNLTVCEAPHNADARIFSKRANLVRAAHDRRRGAREWAIQRLARDEVELQKNIAPHAKLNCVGGFRINGYEEDGWPP